MNIKKKMNQNFKNLNGGLFEEVSKADVGDGVSKLLEKGVDIMAWADPFFPDPSIPDSVKQVMVQAIEKGFPSHYSMPIGDFELRCEIAKKINKRTGLDINPSRNVIVTPGSDSGLIFSMMPFINEGDEIMVIDPSYPSNFLNPTLLGGVTVPVPIFKEDNYQINIKEFEKRLTEKTKMIVITHPNNPTTTVFRKKSIEELCEFIIKNDLILISDQAFEDHIYDNIEFVSPATIEGMWERMLTVCSISKGIGLSGFRIGYVYGSDKIIDVLYGSAVNIIGAAATITSIGAIAALKDEEHLKDMYTRLERRKKIAEEIFSSIPLVDLTPIESGILTWIDVSKVGTSKEVAKFILEKGNVLVNEGSPYGKNGEGHLRIVTGCFKSDEDAKNAFIKIKNSIIELIEKKNLI